MGAVEPNLEGLLLDQKEQFSSLMKEYEDSFAMSSFDLGKTDLMEHEINTMKLHTGLKNSTVMQMPCDDD